MTPPPSQAVAMERAAASLDEARVLLAAGHRIAADYDLAAVFPADRTAALVDEAAAFVARVASVLAARD